MISFGGDAQKKLSYHQAPWSDPYISNHFIVRVWPLLRIYSKTIGLRFNPDLAEQAFLDLSVQLKQVTIRTREHILLK